jgi:hypothetical protein
MKLSFRRYKKARKKSAQGRKLRPSDVYAIREGTYRIELKKVQARRTSMSVMTAVIGAAQMACITAAPIPTAVGRLAFLTGKALKVAQIAIDAAEALKNIMNEHPDPVREWLTNTKINVPS